MADRHVKGHAGKSFSGKFGLAQQKDELLSRGDETDEEEARRQDSRHDYGQVAFGSSCAIRTGRRDCQRGSWLKRGDPHLAEPASSGPST